MSFPHRGAKGRIVRKREEKIKSTIERRKMEESSLKRNIKVYSEVGVNTKTDYIIIELYFYDELYSANEIKDKLVERMGDIF
jgi:hypothetical protein